MKKNLNFIALIPARSGSVAIKNKNIIKFRNKMLIEHTLLAAQKSNFIKEKYISTNSNKYISILKNYKNFDFVKRPNKFSLNNSKAKEVVLHFINHYKKNNSIKNKNIIYLQPTSPFRNHIDIDKAIDLYIKKRAKSLISIKQIDNKYLKIFSLRKNKIKLLTNKNYSNYNRQSLPDVYLPNGAIYIFKISEFMKAKDFPVVNAIPFIMSDKKSYDIDTIDDIKILDLNEKSFFKNQ